jgi:hypothetical protein
VAQDLPRSLLERIKAVSNKRAKIVLDSIVKNGAITTEELKNIGYDHPPRAARDVRELGIPLKTTMVKNSIGRRMAAYAFDEMALDATKTGRKLLPKKVRDGLIKVAGGKCQICRSEHNLQVDHRVPFEVAGESLLVVGQPYQVLCGSCNRKKSWACEHCSNWLDLKVVKLCQSCYWSGADPYSHVALAQERRVDLVWIGAQVEDYDRLDGEARSKKADLKQLIKAKLKR